MTRFKIKKKNETNAMAVDSIAAARSPTNEPQAMDESENVSASVSVRQGALRKVKVVGRPMKRSKNVRKKKAVAKALSRSEQSDEKISKTENKVLRTKSAKNLYQ